MDQGVSDTYGHFLPAPTKTNRTPGKEKTV
jgi:hypothetical protein